MSKKNGEVNVNIIDYINCLVYLSKKIDILNP